MARKRADGAKKKRASSNKASKGASSSKSSKGAKSGGGKGVSS